VIACNTHGPAAIVRDGESGWLVPPDDEQALAAVLIEAASQARERRRRGQRAGAEARRRYGWAAIATRVASLYQEVVAQREKGGAEAEPRRDRSGG
jgi:glycosyltransferase involved in cell wall biosynthesis